MILRYALLAIVVAELLLSAVGPHDRIGHDRALHAAGFLRADARSGA